MRKVCFKIKNRLCVKVKFWRYFQMYNCLTFNAFFKINLLLMIHTHTHTRKNLLAIRLEAFIFYITLKITQSDVIVVATVHIL